MGNTVIIQVVTVTGTREEADRIASVLVERRLAACVQVSGPITSTYRWKGKVETAEEWRCSIKTLARNYQAVEEAIRELHSYELPEIQAFPVMHVLPAFAEWIMESVSLDTSGGGK
ncbi:MAG: divalent-cation tolerance protein CutA [Deltaproteobacteria bacterium]